MVRKFLPLRHKEATIGWRTFWGFSGIIIGRSTSCFFDTRDMEELKRSITQYGQVIGTQVLKVDGFLNHRLDVRLLAHLGKDVYEHFSDCDVDEIVTIEASGIGYAVLTAQFFNCPVVFAKKKGARNQSEGVYTANVHSFTHGNDNVVAVDKRYIRSGDKVLIMDDFLAYGEAVRGLLSICEQAGAEVVGVACAIEKGFQGGGDALRAQGVNLYSQAIVDRMDEHEIVFRD